MLPLQVYSHPTLRKVILKIYNLQICRFFPSWLETSSDFIKRYFKQSLSNNKNLLEPANQLQWPILILFLDGRLNFFFTFE